MKKDTRQSFPCGNFKQTFSTGRRVSGEIEKLEYMYYFVISILTHVNSMFHFYTTWKRQKTWRFKGV